MTAFSLMLQRPDLQPPVVAWGRWRLQRKHVLMLVLAAAVLVMGARRAETYRPPGISVNQTNTPGHAIT